MKSIKNTAVYQRSGKRYRILVVDDEPNEMRSLVIGLKLEGFDADGASNGHIALEMLNEKEYSVVIIDLMMPEMNGLQLARAVRRAHPEITTIMMSAYHLSPVQLAKADTGVVGFVPKPFSFDELVRFILRKVDPQTPVKVGSFSPGGNRELNAPIDIAGVASDN